MAGPFIFISTYTIKEGMLDSFRRFLQELFSVLEPNVPGLLAINAYLNEDGNEATIVQIHTDGASMSTAIQATSSWRGRGIRREPAFM